MRFLVNQRSFSSCFPSHIFALSLSRMEAALPPLLHVHEQCLHLTRITHGSGAPLQIAAVSGGTPSLHGTSGSTHSSRSSYSFNARETRGHVSCLSGPRGLGPRRQLRSLQRLGSEDTSLVGKIIHGFFFAYRV